MKRNLSNVIFFRETNAKKQGKKEQQKNKEGEINKKARNKQKKQETRETESEKGKVKEAKEKERETLRNEQNNLFPGENSVFAKDKKHKILRRVEGQQPQNTRAGFFWLSLWSPHGHVSSSYTLFIAKVSLILFFFVFRSFVFLLLGGCVSFLLFPFLSLLCSLFLILLFLFLHFLCVTKKTRSNHRISEMFILIFCCRACILAFSLGPAENPYSDQRTTPQNGI